MQAANTLAIHSKVYSERAEEHMVREGGLLMNSQQRGVQYLLCSWCLKKVSVNWPGTTVIKPQHHKLLALMLLDEKPLQRHEIKHSVAPGTHSGKKCMSSREHCLGTTDDVQQSSYRDFSNSLGLAIQMLTLKGGHAARHTTLWEMHSQPSK